MYKPIVYPYCGPSGPAGMPLEPSPPPNWPNCFELAAMVAQKNLDPKQVPNLDPRQNEIFVKTLELMTMTDAQYESKLCQECSRDRDPPAHPPPTRVTPRPPTMAPPAHVLPKHAHEAARMRVRHRIQKYKAAYGGPV